MSAAAAVVRLYSPGCWKRHIGENTKRWTKSRLRFASSSASLLSEESEPQIQAEMQRLRRIRNVGIFAHVDAGKTTVTERMLALAGVVRQAGNVDDGNTVTDYLPAERERGITIQSAAVSFQWGWHNNKTGDDLETNDEVTVSLIDTPGHCDFSVEVNRSVAVLDGAVLVVDAVAGVQAQTEFVWKAMTRPALNNHDTSEGSLHERQDHAHEPLPCLAVINKMDKEGSDFYQAIESLRSKLEGAVPVPIQLPLFRSSNTADPDTVLGGNITTVNTGQSMVGDFVGVVDLVHMRAVVWPTSRSSNVDDNIPTVTTLVCPSTMKHKKQDCAITQTAWAARKDLIAALAEHDAQMEEMFLMEVEPSNTDIRAALRRTTLRNKCLPVLAASAVKAQGVELILDAVADLLPSPLDRLPPALRLFDGSSNHLSRDIPVGSWATIGHPLSSKLLALAFKVVHMKGRGGSGDGRVVFARVYSGKLSERDSIQIVSPPSIGEQPEKPRSERIGGILELAGGRFDNMENGECLSGQVCAIIGLKTVVTGDTLLMSGNKKKTKKKDDVDTRIACLAGVSAPKPVVTVRLEAESTSEQAKLSEALCLLAIEDPSLLVEDSESATLLSGLGELHIEVALDRIHREHGLLVSVGAPSVSYKETLHQSITPDEMVEFDQTFGDVRLQASIKVRLDPEHTEVDAQGCMVPKEPVIRIASSTRIFLGLNPESTDEELRYKSPLVKALVQGCLGSMKRGPLHSLPLSNVSCTILDIGCEGGLAQLERLPGALQAAAAMAVSSLLKSNKSCGAILEPSMSIEVTVSNSYLGDVVSDLSSRRGVIDHIGAGETSKMGVTAKGMIRGSVPLAEILGYATTLRTLTAGEGAFTAEYRGHMICDDIHIRKG